MMAHIRDFLIMKERNYEGNFWTRPLAQDEYRILLWFWLIIARAVDILKAIGRKCLKFEKFDIKRTIKEALDRQHPEYEFFR